MKHLKYLRYLRLHRRYVREACNLLGVPWQGLTHDLSKFRLSEWRPYAEYFYGEYPQSRTEPQKGNPPPNVSDAFQRATLMHIHRNQHHWAHWLLHRDDGSIQCLWIPINAAKEMMADWYGFAKANGAEDGWKAAWEGYQQRMDSIALHPKTRQFIEANLNYLAHGGRYEDHD